MFRILPRRHQREDGGWRVEFSIEAGSRRQLVTYDFPASLGEPLTDDAVVPMGLFAAMAHRLPFKVENPIDELLAENAATAMDLASEWWARALAPVPLDFPIRAAAPTPSNRGKAAFFTGGVDSWDTLFAHETEISHLIYVHGFDVPGQTPDEQAMVGRRVREAAAARGFALHEIHTNHRESGEELVGNFEFSHGAMLAAVGLMLAETIDIVFVASSNRYSQMFPHGSTWMLDPLWSTSQVRIRYDGAEKWRSLKAFELATKHPELLPHVIVCWDGYLQGKNCGQCEKCLRTMMAMHFAGIEDLSPAFQRHLDPSAIEAIRFTGPWMYDIYGSNLEIGRTHRPDSPILPALESCLRENKARLLLARLAEATTTSIEAPDCPKLLRGIRDPLWQHWSSHARRWLERRTRDALDSDPARAVRTLWS
jgi:hypothetical protein